MGIIFHNSIYFVQTFVKNRPIPYVIPTVIGIIFTNLGISLEAGHHFFILKSLLLIGKYPTIYHYNPIVIPQKSQM